MLQGVVLEGGVGRLKHIWERWWLVRCRRVGGGRGSAGAAKIIGGGFERSDGCIWSVKSAMRGEWNARACVVLLGMVVPALVCMASAIASKSSRLSRIS